MRGFSVRDVAELGAGFSVRRGTRASQWQGDVDRCLVLHARGGRQRPRHAICTLTWTRRS